MKLCITTQGGGSFFIDARFGPELEDELLRRVRTFFLQSLVEATDKASHD